MAEPGEELPGEVPGDEDEAGEKKKEWVGRETWVRGLDHVLPIDAEMGNWCGPVEKLVEMLDSGEVDKEELDIFNLRCAQQQQHRSRARAAVDGATSSLASRTRLSCAFAGRS